MKKETILKKAPKFTEEIRTETLGEAETFVRRKTAEYIIWERKLHDYIIKYGLYPSVKVTIELDIEEK